jgi:hypothetical protein
MPTPGDVLLTAADNNGATRRRAGVVKGNWWKCDAVLKPEDPAPKIALKNPGDLPINILHVVTGPPAWRVK